MHARTNTQTTQRCDGDRVDTDNSGTTGRGSELHAETQDGQAVIRERWKAKSRLRFVGVHHYYLSGFGGKASPTCLEPHHVHSNALAFKSPGPTGCVRKSSQPFFSRAIFVFFSAYNMRRESKSASSSTWGQRTRASLTEHRESHICHQRPWKSSGRRNVKVFSFW